MGLNKIGAMVRLSKGQTMTEYVLVMSAIAVAVFAGYQHAGIILNSMVAKVVSLL